MHRLSLLISISLSIGAALASGACGGSSSGATDAPPSMIDAAGTTTDAPSGGWTAPACTIVKGTGGVTFTHDEGKTLAATDSTLTPPSYTMGLVALAEPGHLLAGHDGTILRSVDAGCTWTSIGTTADTVFLIAAGAHRAYGWQDNGTALVRVDDATVTPLTAPGTGTILGLGVDPANPDHVRLGDANAQLWDSSDGGAHWAPQGVPAIAGGNALVYRATFDPASIDHALFGTATTGALVTTTGGASWAPSTGTAAGASGRSNVFHIVFSPADPTIVWAQGIDLSDGDARHVWRSSDGGQSFTAVITEGNGVSLQNGASMFAHPTDPGVLYVAFGVAFQNHGTDVYRYDQAHQTITTTHNSYHRLFGVAFLPGDPSWMYFGVSLEPSGG